MTFTIKNLQFVKLLLALEHFHINGDGEGRLHSDDPRAGLGVGVVFWEARTQDHTRGGRSLLICRTLSCRVDTTFTGIIAIIIIFTNRNVLFLQTKMQAPEYSSKDSKV